jgi:HD-GYP domain-containing protein (c-di-GMP phosphodiesterase class II)
VKEHSPIIEFEELSEAFRVMKSAIAAKTQALETALQKLERIIELGIAMSVEQNADKLVEMILKGAKELSGADGGSLYLKGEKDVLDFKIVLNDSLGFEQGGAGTNPITLPPVQLYMENGEANFHNVVSSAFHKAETIVIDDAYEDPDYDFSGTKHFDKLNNYRSTSFLTVPLKLQGSDIIGALQLINCRDEKENEVVPFNADIQSFIEALSALAAAILYNRTLLDSQDALFESLIQLTASAIDTKSPYTGGHCERVPVLAQMLAEKAEEVIEGPLAHFRFSTAIEKKAFIIGAWLHDAGKMTTPEFIVDKAVKLETIHNRIHEIRTRFEVLMRDVRLMEKEALLAGKNPSEAASELEAAEKKLFDDFEFIARANTGGEIVNENYIRRLNEISKINWISHFDHTIGLSREEQEKTKIPYTKGKTIREQLLSDKPQHIIPDKGKTRKIYTDYGFKLPHPDYLYNRGEIHNLLIKNGTLTEEERYKINEHIMQTIVMLDQLPFPVGMTKIPEFVGTHHETLTGTGYPRGLKSEQLSVPSRIMAIADIFEALTASDRPYKDAKTLSEAVEILYQQSLTKHIDTDLFELFLTSGIYRKYADRFIPPGQIDEVNIEKFIRKA